MQLYALAAQVPLGDETGQCASQDADDIGAQHGAGKRSGCEAHDERKRLKKIETILRPTTFATIKSQLRDLCIDEITVTEVRTCGRQDDRKEFYRGAQYDVLLPQVKVEMLVPAHDLAEAIEIISRGALPAQAGFEETILAYDVAETIRIPVIATAESALP